MTKKLSSSTRPSDLVYSTESGRHCPVCCQPAIACICKNVLLNEGDGIVRVRKETKGRGGKIVTTIMGINLSQEKLKGLVTSLKRRCGTGGTLKQGIIEIQGDHVDLLLAELSHRGFKVKKSGG